MVRGWLGSATESPDANARSGVVDSVRVTRGVNVNIHHSRDRISPLARGRKACAATRSSKGIAINIGMITDSLGDDDFDTMLSNPARMNMDMLEFACGNWSQAPHIELDRMLASDGARREFKAKH